VAVKKSDFEEVRGFLTQCGVMWYGMHYISCTGETTGYSLLINREDGSLGLA
jgi:hypothetical protein